MMNGTLVTMGNGLFNGTNIRSMTMEISRFVRSPIVYFVCCKICINFSSLEYIQIQMVLVDSSSLVDLVWFEPDFISGASMDSGKPTDRYWYLPRCFFERSGTEPKSFLSPGIEEKCNSPDTAQEWMNSLLPQGANLKYREHSDPNHTHQNQFFTTDEIELLKSYAQV